jgi:hypothetical protein
MLEKRSSGAHAGLWEEVPLTTTEIVASLMTAGDEPVDPRNVMATTDSRAGLELARDRLLARLHARSDDYAATRELQRVSRQLAAFDSADDDRTRRVGQSGL